MLASHTNTGLSNSQNEKCKCCPYGFHLDLDFVSFAENVASGRERRKPLEYDFKTEKSKPQSGNITYGTNDKYFSPSGSNGSAFKSLSKKSLTDVVNDLSALSHNYDHVTGPSISKTNLNQNLLPAQSYRHHQKDMQRPLYNEVPYVTAHNAHGSLLSSGYYNEERTPSNEHKPQFINEFRVTEQSNAYSPFDPYATLPSTIDQHEHSKTPLTVYANEEVSNIFSDNAKTLPTTLKRVVTSAPTSPTPGKSFYTALGQSLANLRTRAPMSPILHKEDTPFSVSTMQSESANRGRQYERATKTKPPLPKRYFEPQKRYPRILSPEPEKTSSPSTLRNSNIQNRTYYASTSPRAEYNTDTSRERTIPYRSKSAGRLPSFYDNFVSVQRTEPETKITDKQSYRSSTTRPEPTYSTLEYKKIRPAYSTLDSSYSKTGPSHSTLTEEKPEKTYSRLNKDSPSTRQDPFVEQYQHYLRYATDDIKTKNKDLTTKKIDSLTSFKDSDIVNKNHTTNKNDLAKIVDTDHTAKKGRRRSPISTSTIEDPINLTLHQSVKNSNSQLYHDNNCYKKEDSPVEDPCPKITRLENINAKTPTSKQESQLYNQKMCGGSTPIVEEVTKPLLKNTMTQTPPFNVTVPKNKTFTTVNTETEQKIIYEQFTQTQIKLKREIGCQINVAPKQNTPRTVNTSSSPIHFNGTHVSTDTVDLRAPKKKWNEGLSVEFQYCIGHESEHHLADLLAIASPKTFSDAAVDVRPELKEIGTHQQPIVSQFNGQTDTIKSADRIPVACQTTAFLTTSSLSSETQTNTDWLQEKNTNLEKQVLETENYQHLVNSNIDKKHNALEITEDNLVKLEVTDKKSNDTLQSGIKLTKAMMIQTEKKINQPIQMLKKTSPMSEEEWEFEDLERQVAREAQPQKFPTVVIERTAIKSVEEVIRESEKRKSPQEIQEQEEAEMLANLDRLATIDADRLSIDTDVQTVIMLDAINQEKKVHAIVNEKGDHVEIQKNLTPYQTDAIRKLLTEPNKGSFQRESGAYRSFKVEKTKASDLDYITEKHTQVLRPQPSTTPSSDPEKPLKEMVVLKKYQNMTSIFPEPISAKIPRPKITKYSPQPAETEHAETADEAAEAQDKLTPLRSELQYFDEWRSNRYRRFRRSPYETPPQIDLPDYDSDEEATGYDPNDPVSTSSNSSLTSDEADIDRQSSDDENVSLELSAPLNEALETLNKNLLEDPEESMHSTDWAEKYVQHEWLRLSTKKNANAEILQQFLNALTKHSTRLLETVINFQDQNGNTALHYAVSHENYSVVSTLLDAKVCRVDDTNKAGYSPVMLAALCDIKNETESAIVQRLFERGDVNAKAIYHGQTALMLAVSHGRIETTNLLLKCGADVNLKDIDGSTALMCAAEHGHKDLVKILLKRPGIDASLTDCDNQSALSIAMENQHRDIGVLIYAHLNYGRSDGQE